MLEVERVRAHLAGAEAMMRARDVSHLSEAQRYVRRLLLEELRIYREAGVFPRNPDFAELTPYFVDADGVRCAMAHLLEVGGRADLVRKIARQRNNAYVRELADEPELVEWLEAAGITVAEAARIQPSYCPQMPASCLCEATPTGVIDGTVLQESADAGGSHTIIQVDAVHGNTGGVKVGDAVESYHLGEAIGAKVVLRGSGPTRNWQKIDQTDDGQITCVPIWSGEAQRVTLSKGEAIDAMTSSQCVEKLRAKKGSWAEKPDCGGKGAFGCTSSSRPVAADATLAIIAAVVMTRLVRRLRGV